jgi:hypothetical protein
MPIIRNLHTAEIEQSDPDNFLDDPWLDQGFDTTYLSDEKKVEFNKKFGLKPKPKDPFDRPVFEPKDDLKTKLLAELRNPDVVAELSERDPNWRNRNKAALIEGVIEQFRASNPFYYATEKNAVVLTRYLNNKFLHRDWLDDDAAASELFDLGRWNKDTLAEAFSACSAQGSLDVDPGSYKQLSKKEELAVIASAQLEGPAEAVIQYLEYAYSGKVPRGGSTAVVNKFRTEHPDLLNRAILFVWRASRPESLNDDIFEQFKSDLLAAHPLLTMELVEKFYQNWCKPTRRTALFPNGQPQGTIPSRDYNNMTDEELQWELSQAKAAVRKARGWD